MIPCGMPRPPLDRSNNDDRRQRRKRGVAVGAAASRMRGPHQGPKQMLGAATRAVASRSDDGEVLSRSGSRSGCPSYNLSVCFADSSPRGGASGVSVRFRLNEQSLIYHKQECPATEASSSLTRNSVPKLLPSVAGHSFLRYIELSAVSSELTGLPMAPPLGELSRRRRD